MMPDEDVVLKQQVFLCLHIDIEIGIALVNVVKGDRQIMRDQLEHPPVDPGLFEPGMGKENEDFVHRESVMDRITNKTGFCQIG